MSVVVVACLVFLAWVVYQLRLAAKYRRKKRALLLRGIRLCLEEGKEMSALDLADVLGVSTRELYPILHEAEARDDISSRGVPDFTGYRGGRPRVLYRANEPRLAVRYIPMPGLHAPAPRDWAGNHEVQDIGFAHSLADLDSDSSSSDCGSGGGDSSSQCGQ